MASMVKVLLFMRRCVLVHLKGRTYNNFVTALNTFNQTAVDLLGYKMIRDAARVEERLIVFSKSLSDISQYAMSAPYRVPYTA